MNITSLIFGGTKIVLKYTSLSSVTETKLFEGYSFSIFRSYMFNTVSLNGNRLLYSQFFDESCCQFLQFDDYFFFCCVLLPPNEIYFLSGVLSGYV